MYYLFFKDSFKSKVHDFLEQVKTHRENHKHLMAIDVSFDGLGCLFILANWRFQKVSTFSTIVLYLSILTRSVC